jgi:hypothetical protein
LLDEKKKKKKKKKMMMMMKNCGHESSFPDESQDCAINLTYMVTSWDPSTFIKPSENDCECGKRSTIAKEESRNIARS